MQIARTLQLTIISISLCLAGCASSTPTPAKGSPSVKEAYEAAMRFETHTDGVKRKTLELPMLEAETTPMLTTLNAQFPALKNPQSVMYIFGHYAGAEQLPVAGHFVPFALYPQTYYALPSEVSMPTNDGQFGVMTDD